MIGSSTSLRQDTIGSLFIFVEYVSIDSKPANLDYGLMLTEYVKYAIQSKTPTVTHSTPCKIP